MDAQFRLAEHRPDEAQTWTIQVRECGLGRFATQVLLGAQVSLRPLASFRMCRLPHHVGTLGVLANRRLDHCSGINELDPMFMT